MKGLKKTQYDKIKHLLTKATLFKIVVFSLTFIILLYFGVSLIKLISDEKSIDINGLKELNNLDVETYDVKALSLELNDDEIIVAPMSYKPEDGLAVHIVFYITKDTNFYKRVINNTINSYGETFSTIDYEAITRFDLQKIIDSEKNGILTYFWTNASNECSNILISYE